jgi:protein-arginine kinase activator protein McsA
MPLPSIKLHGAKQCTAKSKRTDLPCNNPAAYGCRTCRMHGARKAESIKRGEQHPNFVHGGRTLEAQAEQSAVSRRLQQIEDAMHLLKMTTVKRSRGRKAAGYRKLTSLDEIKKVIK